MQNKKKLKMQRFLSQKGKKHTVQQTNQRNSDQILHDLWDNKK